MGHLQVEFESSYEQTGPFGAKSIGEIVINTPAPALAQAIFRATGTWHRNLPITPEKVLLGRMNKHIIYLAAGSAAASGATSCCVHWRESPCSATAGHSGRPGPGPEGL